MKYFKVFMDIDSQLINQKTEDTTEKTEAEKAGEFREEQRGGIPGKTGEEAAGIREAVRRDKIAGPKQLTGKTQERKSSENSFLTMTDGLLKGAWTNLLPSWGLTLFWIDIHVFLNKVLGPWAFRDLGEEWIPASIKKVDEQKSKEAASMLRLSESAGCGCLNLGCLFLVIAILSVIALIVRILTDNPLYTVPSLIGMWFTNLFK